MATHSSVLAWRIPGTGEPGGLPSMGSQSRTRLKPRSSSSSSRASLVAQMVKNLCAIWETGVQSLGQGRCLGERNGNLLQYSCLENSTGRGAWQAIVMGSQRVGLDWATNTSTFHQTVIIYRFEILKISLKNNMHARFLSLIVLS